MEKKLRLVPEQLTKKLDEHAGEFLDGIWTGMGPDIRKEAETKKGVSISGRRLNLFPDGKKKRNGRNLYKKQLRIMRRLLQ